MSNQLKTYYIKQGNTFSVTDSQNIDIHDHLPAGTYVALFDPKRGFFLSQVDSMTIPKKIYGNTGVQIDRIYKTFSSRTRNTGVLLNGEKGAGKTLTLALLAYEFMENNLPVIIINSAFCGDDFNKFISEISQPCMIAFDEFDKTYDSDDQAKILTLLDGVFNSKKLFVLTCNDSWKINSFMINRPGRIFYNISYRHLDEKAIREYCTDVLENKENLEGVLTIASTVDAFNFDMLKALVEEMNRFNETAKQAITMLNIRPERASYINYKYLVSREGKVVYTNSLHNSVSPLNGKPFEVPLQLPNPKYDPNDQDNYEDDSIYSTIILTHKDVVNMDSNGYVFEKDGWTVTIVKEDTSSSSFGDYL